MYLLGYTVKLRRHQTARHKKRKYGGSGEEVPSDQRSVEEIAQQERALGSAGNIAVDPVSVEGARPGVVVAIAPLPRATVWNPFRMKIKAAGLLRDVKSPVLDV